MSMEQGAAIFGNSIADALQDYHKRHVQYDQQMKIAEALSNIGITEQGQITPLTQPDVNGKQQKLEGVVPLLNSKAYETFKTTKQSEWDKNTGALHIINQLAVGTAAKAIGQRLEDQSLSGQRTQQIMQQSAESFPSELEGRKAQTEHIKKLTNEEGKINVPGFGMMTPPQYSAHVARQERMQVLQKKLDPALNFEQQLQGAYGLGIKDIVDASQPQTFTGGKGKTFKGTPFFNVAGEQIDQKTAFAKPGESFVQAGPNKVPIPLLSKGGLGWQQIVPKAKNLATQMDEVQTQQQTLQSQSQQHQAQQIIAINQGKDPATLSPQDQQALAWAKQVLGQ